ncbi:MAG: mandelate racemase/muconate lactonizing enzyme family protein [Acidobacteriaceae bacterium]|nr:mandelate racemase/muconate lactonizing enzyme family protein [Acidobacteriaceae bacterium]
MRVTRRSFLNGLLTSSLASAYAKAATTAAPMRITAVETVYWKLRNDAPFWPHWTWVKISTDAGVSGIGETYPKNASEAAAIHGAAGALIGHDPRDIERIWADLYRAFDFNIAGGAEMRALSAIDLALWDLLGKSLGAPVYRLIGGAANPEVRLYNTCFPYKHDFNREPEKIMRELIDTRGITAIKIWPFDGAARAGKNQYISWQAIDQALTPVKKLRDTFGSEIEIAIEFHAQWNLTSAIRIAHALEPYRPMWLEDMLMPGNFQQYHELAAATSLPLIAGERMAGKMQFEQLLASRTTKYVMFDVTWCGGLTEAHKIAAMADAYELPIAPHTAGGPLLFYASTHLTTASPNVWIQESCQRFYEQDWPMMLENPIVPKAGHIQAPEESGFGMKIKAEAWNHPAAVRQVSGRAQVS